METVLIRNLEVAPIEPALCLRQTIHHLTGGNPMINVDYPALLKLFPEYLDPKRSESASFLIWYLENYYRVDPLDAVDSVCDQKGDKGVDGIFVNDSDQTITIFQSKISQNAKSTIGDVALKEFAGTISQFETEEKIDHLIKTAGRGSGGLTRQAA